VAHERGHLNGVFNGKNLEDFTWGQQERFVVKYLTQNTR
jgi:hypothetical protein